MARAKRSEAVSLERYTDALRRLGISVYIQVMSVFISTASHPQKEHVAKALLLHRVADHVREMHASHTLPGYLQTS
jgi:hypothetical protein